MKYIEREISVLKGVRHPFIVGFSGVCLHDTGLYIITEYVDGGDVRALLKSGRVSWSKRIQLAHDLAKSMYYLHTKKIIHRDLKAKNLLIGSDGRLRLCDFGFARMSEFNKSARAMTICGTPGYVAPEIMMGYDYDEACDVFSYGNVIAELITLQRPGKDFWNRTPDDEYQLNFDEIRALAPKECPMKFTNLCLKCCEYNSRNRPDFAEIVKIMKQIENELPKEVKPETLSTSPAMSIPKSPGIPTKGEVGMHRKNSNFPKEEGTPNFGSVLQAINSSKLKLSSGEEEVSEKHLQKMVMRAINPDIFETEYLQDLLLCFPCFATPNDLLNIIIERFTNRELDPTQPIEVAQKKAQLTTIRIIVFLNSWIEKYYSDFLEPGMSELVAAFDILATSNEDFKEPFSIIAALEKAKSKAIPPPILTPRMERKDLDSLQLLNHNVSAADIGRQITLLDISLLKLIQPREYLKENWKLRSDSHISAFLKRCEDLSRWVATSIVKLESKEGRVALITKFVDVAQQCLNLKNFNGLFAIMNAFEMPSVQRLTQSWAAVRPAVMNTLKSFKELTSKDEHFKQYKLKQQVALPPCIPYLRVHLEEISYIDAFNPDIGKGGIINFTKHRKIARSIRTLVQYSNSSYTDLNSIDSIQQMLLHTQILDDDALQNRSLNSEKPTGFV
eukprot:TRINITY_DN6827_c0_g1_i1.p1 TRINITY_DN6827_c0_g1~~TRINITY_DN6827_c0_g1_i1.p1  ORF type:complete len:749 (-),score=181.47 TRINITY_DN6827_c0_g1_i1:62-2080(-)